MGVYSRSTKTICFDSPCVEKGYQTAVDMTTVLKDYRQRAEHYSHDKSLGGGIPGHILGYGLAALDAPLRWATGTKQSDYVETPKQKNFRLYGAGDDAYYASKRSAGVGSTPAIKQTAAPAVVMPSKQQKKKKQGGSRFAALARSLRATRLAAARYNARRKNNRPSKTSVGVQGKNIIQRVAPPTIYGRTRKSGASIEFLRGSRPGCLKIRGQVQIAEIWAIRQTSTTTGGPMPAGTYNTTYFNLANGSDVTVLDVMPQSSYYFPAPVWLLTQLFERYQIKTRLHYFGSSGTAATGTVKFAYFEDPVGWYAMTNKNTDLSDSVNFPQPSDFRGLTTAVEGPVWGEFSTNWTIIPKDADLKYVPATAYASIVEGQSTTASAFRAQCAGVWVTTGANLTNPGTTPGTGIGDLWMEYELELCDIISTTVGFTVSLSNMFSALDGFDDLPERLSKLPTKLLPSSISLRTTTNDASVFVDQIEEKLYRRLGDKGYFQVTKPIQIEETKSDDGIREFRSSKRLPRCAVASSSHM